MARSPLRHRIVAIGAFYAMYVMIRWWMMCSYRLRRSIESRTLHTKYLMSYHNRRENMTRMVYESDATSVVNIRMNIHAFSTGSNTIDLGEEDDDIQETQRSSPIDDFDFVEASTSSVTSKRKRHKSMDGDEIYRESCKEMKEVLVRFEEIVGETLNKESLEASEIYEKVSDELKALPGITMTKRFKVAHLIGKDVVLGRSFLGLTQEEKIGMVESYTDGSMG